MAKKKQPDKTTAANLLDAVAEFVHQGYGQLLDAGELRMTFDRWKLNGCANCEYVFAWNLDLDIDSL